MFGATAGESVVASERVAGEVLAATPLFVGEDKFVAADDEAGMLFSVFLATVGLLSLPYFPQFESQTGFLRRVELLQLSRTQALGVRQCEHQEAALGVQQQVFDPKFGLESRLFEGREGFLELQFEGAEGRRGQLAEVLFKGPLLVVVDEVDFLFVAKGLDEGEQVGARYVAVGTGVGLEFFYFLGVLQEDDVFDEGAWLFLGSPEGVVAVSGPVHNLHQSQDSSASSKLIITMSKKGLRPQSKPEEPVLLPDVAIAEAVTVLLPPHLASQHPQQPLLQSYLRLKINGKRVTPGQHLVLLFKGKQETLSLQQVQGPGEGAHIVSPATHIRIAFAQKTAGGDRETSQSADSPFYGFEEELDDLLQSIRQSLFERPLLIANGLGPLRGILVSGCPGAGKTALVSEAGRQLRQACSGLAWKSISSVALLSRVVGGAEQFVRSLFMELRKAAPAVLLIEDLHLLFGAKEAAAHETTLAALLAEMEQTQAEQLVVLATYDSERQLARSLRSSGRFEKEVALSLPGHSTRLEVLSRMVARLSLQEPLSPESLRRANLRLNGFTIGEIKQLLREAFLKWGSGLDSARLEELLRRHRPAEIRELVVEVPEVRWGQIGGYEEVKRQIRKVVELPLREAARFAALGVEPSKGILLFGPPGCSKTMLAKAIATESGLNFLAIKGPQLFSKYVGDSERAIRSLFKRARACSPCVVFFDEIDAIATQRSGNTQVSERVLCQLLNEMDGIEGLKEVVIVAATNRPEILDKALTRPGRFDYLIYVGPPDLAARLAIFRIYLAKSAPPEDLESLSQAMAERTQDYTGAEISLVCREAAVLALEQDLECQGLRLSHLQKALLRFRKRLSALDVSRYQQFSSTLRHDY